MDQHSNYHVAAELIVLGGLLERVAVDIRHEGVEEDEVDGEEDLDCCDGRIEIGSYLPL